jgi:hypothetical protein
MPGGKPLGPSRGPARPPSRFFGSPWFAIGAIALIVVVVAAVVVIPITHERGYVFLRTRGNGAPVRWDPCRPIHFVMNLSLAPGDELPDVEAAIGRVSEATGIRFVDDGSTSAMPPGAGGRMRLRTPAGRSWPPLLIAWTDEAEFRALGGSGQAVALADPIPRPDGLYYVTGFVAVDADAGLLPGFGLGATVGPVLLHELGHIMGLAHVSAPFEIMNAQENPIVTDYADGDLEGLRLLGRSAGCPAHVSSSDGSSR